MIDVKAILFANAGAMWKILSGPITLLFIASGLAPVEQGIYFTFISIAAIQQVFELGFSVVLVQTYASQNNSREYSDFSNDINVKGLHVFSIVTYFLIALVFYICAYNYGIYIFKDVPEFDHLTLICWRWYLFFIAISLLVIPFYSHMEGGLLVRNVYKSRFISIALSSSILWTLLFFNYGLIALVISQAVLVLSQFISIRKYIYNSCINIFKKRDILYIGFIEFKKASGFQLKLALVWATGYFYWNSYNLIFFKLVSPVYAGVFGMTFALFNAFSVIAQNIVLVNRAKISNAITSNGIDNALRSFKCLQYVSIVVFLICITFLFLLKFILPHFFIFNRILETNSMILLSIMFFCTTAICNYATFTRCFGIEALFKLSIIMNVIIPVITLLYTKFIGLDGLLIYIALAHVIFLLLSIVIIRNFIIRTRLKI
ncbi:hypothetical protein SOASR032_24320 [Pragia fontium]|uniref:Polysaccharide biosynthesis protein n=1 Tax=Pragia fontium TaxID=82985 RepID=A0ABQ5LML1_9GAMM|nr:hypothetical protein [Pragia fontium]GKX63863.1 hypothetical protein SOASR032_24320 [Pragia fontium]